MRLWESSKWMRRALCSLVFCAVLGTAFGLRGVVVIVLVWTMAERPPRPMAVE